MLKPNQYEKDMHAGNIRSRLYNADRIVIKVGSSTITYNNAKPNLTNISRLVRVIADLTNQGKKVVLVTSGAIAIGIGRLDLVKKP
ncbi:MAG: hypothetical protein PHS13_09605, partial [Firmicutes bacterium]|nr:hypothetical protein [Bacillota bacterium]